jgi:hypothetical protein
MSDEVKWSVPTESNILDHEPACKALGNIGQDHAWQLMDAGLINYHKPDKRTVSGRPRCGGAPSSAGADRRERCRLAIGNDQSHPESIMVLPTDESPSGAGISAELTRAYSAVYTISQENPLALTVNSKRCGHE